MTDAIWLELKTLLTSFLGGMCICMVYDFIRIKRNLFPTKAFLVGVEDFCYWFGASIVIFQVMYDAYDGMIRGFVIITFLLGMLVMRQTGSRLIMFAALKPVNLLRKKVFRPFREKIVGKYRKSVEKKKGLRYNKKKSMQGSRNKERKGFFQLRRDKKKNKRDQRRKASRGGMVAIVFVVVVVFIAVTYMTKSSAAHLQTLEKTKTELEQQVAEAEERTAELEERRIYVQTKAYVEEAAKKMGLVYKDEVIFKPAE